MSGMGDLSVRLVGEDGVKWEFSYSFADVFFVFLSSGFFSFSAIYVAHHHVASRKQFTIYFTNACIHFPVSELEKFEQFLRHARATRMVR